MHAQRSRKGGDRRQQPLLQADERQPRLRRPPTPQIAEATVAQGPVVRQHRRKHQFGRVGRQSVDRHRRDHAFGKALAQPAQVAFQPPDHHRLQIGRADGDAAREPLRIEQFEQCREAVRMAVVRRRGQEQPVFEPRRQVAQLARELRLHRITPSAGRGGMMRLVEDQQRARAKILQHVAKPRDIGFVAEQPVRQDEARSRRPRVRAMPAAAAQILQMPPVDDLERQAELGLQFLAPLAGHRGGGQHHREVDPPAQHHLAQDQPRLDRLAQPHIVGDQQIDARQPQRLAQGEQLIRVEANAGAKRGLEQVALGRGRGAPFDRAEIGGERLRSISTAEPERSPCLLVAQPGVDLGIPEHARRLATGIVVDTGEQMPVIGRGRLALDQPQPPAQGYELADPGLGRCGHGSAAGGDGGGGGALAGWWRHRVARSPDTPVAAIAAASDTGGSRAETEGLRSARTAVSLSPNPCVRQAQ